MEVPQNGWFIVEFLVKMDDDWWCPHNLGNLLKWRFWPSIPKPAEFCKTTGTLAKCLDDAETGGPWAPTFQRDVQMVG